MTMPLRQRQQFGIIKGFTTYLNDDDTFDYFEEVERKLREPDYMKLAKNEANVLYYEDIQVQIEFVKELKHVVFSQ